VVEIPLDIPRDHPAYEGHFPAQPLLPAVVLLAEAFAALDIDARRHSVSQAKFLQPVTPGTALTLAHEANASGLRFEIRAAGRLVASAVVEKRAA
jgi:3-hydroxymyristoyl/3-hydroxydecanoyl-(acyl carrier protein) dehydratase